MTNQKKETIVMIAPTSEELNEIAEFLPDRQYIIKPPSTNFDHSYHKGKIEINEKFIEIILISPHQGGHSATQAILSEAISEWKPFLVILIGVCGGNPKKNIKIGDLLIPRKIISDEKQKISENGIIPDPEYYNPSTELINNVEAFFFQKKWSKKEIALYFPQLKDKKKSRYYKMYSEGMIFSSNSLILSLDSDYSTFQKVFMANRKLYGVEMEAGGVGIELRKSSNISIEWVDIRCVMDDASEESRSEDIKTKNKISASRLVGDFTFQFLSWFLDGMYAKSDEVHHPKKAKIELQHENEENILLKKFFEAIKNENIHKIALILENNSQIFSKIDFRVRKIYGKDMKFQLKDEKYTLEFWSYSHLGGEEEWLNISNSQNQEDKSGFIEHFKAKLLGYGIINGE